MPHVPEELKARLKREVSVQRLAEARGIKLRRVGKELIGLCPFHDDHSPSLNIDPIKNEWHCKGACGRGGDVIEWVMRAEGVSFRHACELLDNNASFSSGHELVKQSTVRKLAPPIKPSAADHELLLQVVGYYTEALKQSPEALQYLAKRGLRDPEMIDHFRLGFANRTLGYRLPASNRSTGAEMRGRLQKLGIYRESGHEHFNGSLVIPVLNLEGAVVQMYGRKITPNLRPGTPDHLYLPGPHRGVWNEEALVVSREIILCEALIDGLTFWCAGFRNVTACYGVNGFTEQHKEAFRKHGTKRIYIAYDRDEAGDAAATKHAEELMEMGIECFRAQFPKGQDANECALRTHPATKVLGVFLNSALWLGKGKRPATAVAALVAEVDEPQQPPEPIIPTPIEEEKSEPAAKEEMATEVSTPPDVPVEDVLSLAAAVAPLASPAAQQIEVPTEIRGEEVLITLGERRYRVLGLGRNTAPGVMKINLMASATNLRGEYGYHVDTLDLYAARQRTVFIAQAAEELGVKDEILRRDLGRVLLKLEALQQAQIAKALEKPKDEIELTAEERAAAMELLCSPNLIERVLADFVKCGVTGEEINKQVGYLAVVSRLLDTPLAVIVQSSSAAGKSSLMEAVLAFMPEEQRVQYSAMTGQSLFYMGETDLKNKILAIVEEEGVQRAAYALKLLQSEGVLTIASTGKDPETGRLITHQYRVEGPVMIFLTTTAIDIDEELLNRCIILTVDEDRKQTQAIHRMQRESQTLEGLLRKRDRLEVLKVHRNAQRLLKPLLVVNEVAPELTFPDGVTRMRRDHMKYLTLIRTIALLHQYQRPVKRIVHRGKTVEYIEAAPEDVELAKRLMNEVLVRSMDELQPQTRRLLVMVDAMVRSACEQQKIDRTEYRFSRRDVRAYTQCSDSQLKRHMARLEELEYLIVHRGGRGQTFVYELYVSCQDEASRPTIAALSPGYDANRSGAEGQKSGGSPAQVRGLSGGGAGAETPITARLKEENGHNLKNRTLREAQENHVVVVPLADRPNGHAKMPAVGVR
jgi:DNA primase catalytic core